MRKKMVRRTRGSETHGSNYDLKLTLDQFEDVRSLLHWCIEPVWPFLQKICCFTQTYLASVHLCSASLTALGQRWEKKSRRSKNLNPSRFLYCQSTAVCKSFQQALSVLFGVVVFSSTFCFPHISWSHSAL